MSALCRVEFAGKDGETRELEIEASSLFDAANQAMQAWSLLWWFNYQDDLTVIRGDDIWKVRQSAVRAWREQQKNQPRL